MLFLVWVEFGVHVLSSLRSTRELSAACESLSVRHYRVAVADSVVIIVSRVAYESQFLKFTKRGVECFLTRECSSH
jgi:hypothetical protein